MRSFILTSDKRVRTSQNWWAVQLTYWLDPCLIVSREVEPGYVADKTATINLNSRDSFRLIFSLFSCWLLGEQTHVLPSPAKFIDWFDSPKHANHCAGGDWFNPWISVLFCANNFYKISTPTVFVVQPWKIQWFDCMMRYQNEYNFDWLTAEYLPVDVTYCVKTMFILHDTVLHCLFIFIHLLLCTGTYCTYCVVEIALWLWILLIENLSFGQVIRYHASRKGIVYFISPPIIQYSIHHPYHQLHEK